MKIAMFTDTYIPQANGVATSVSLYKRALEKLGHEVYVVAPIGPKDDTVFAIGGIQFKWEQNHIVPNSGRLLPLLNFTKQKKIEVIHSHAPFALGFRGLTVQRRLQIPHVHTYHTLLVEYRHYIPKPLTPSAKSVEEFSAWFCNMVNRVIAPTEKIRHELLRYGVTRPVDVIPTGIDVELFESDNDFDIRKHHNIGNKSKILLFVGRLAKEKNVVFVIQVLKALLEKKYDLHLIIVGDGPERASLKQLATELGVESSVTFTGYMPRKVLANYYRQADLFVFASESETQGLVVLESLAAGTPVVAVAKMGIADVLVDGQGALLVEESLLSKFTEKVERLLSDASLYETMAKVGKEYVVKNWSIDAKALLLQEVYKKAIEEGACDHDFRDNVWVEIMFEEMKSIPAKIFESINSGGVKRATIKHLARSRRG
ncbi:MAG TPA: glycosyltransferase family 4 protein [Pseudothermotoga sp.]|nr:glycosyltransferase family 4 protein [Pseudothermotoga sp.]HPP70863.1 glycosyltransferase family 4 protein [Pseudothermotoga sp.]